MQKKCVGRPAEQLVQFSQTKTLKVVSQVLKSPNLRDIFTAEVCQVLSCKGQFTLLLIH